MLRPLLTVGVCLLVPAVAAAGPIRVRLDARVTTAPGDDWLARSLSAVGPAGSVTADPAAPALVSLLRQAPPDLPADDPGNPYRTGASAYGATYHRSGHFTLIARLTDEASGQSGEITYAGRLHANYRYAGNDTYSATSYIWLGQSAQNVGLGDNLYTLHPAGGHYAHVAGSNEFELYVGGLAPQPLPEPGTLLLAGLGLAPLAARLRRRRA